MSAVISMWLHDTARKRWKVMGSAMGALLMLAVLTIVLTRWMPWDAAARAALALPLLLFVPGYAVTWVVFPHRIGIAEPRPETDVRALDTIERTTLAVLLSIVITSLIVYALSPASKLPVLAGRLTPRSLTKAVLTANALLVIIAYVRVRVRSCTVNKRT